MRRPSGGLVGKALDLLETRLDTTVVPKSEYDLLEAVGKDYLAATRQLDLLAWTALNDASGRQHEVKYETRRAMARKARQAWVNDPLVGGAVALLNDFALGRGVPRPRFKDKLCQEVVDEAWDDPDNRRILTDFDAQIALNTDLSLQNNLLLLLFDDGEDGRCKLSNLDYDTVSDYVTDTENRHRVLWYVATEVKAEWDFENDQLKVLPEEAAKPKKRYYEHWHNLKDAESEENRSEAIRKPPKEKMGDGRVFHVATNRTMEMIFGVPEWQRTLRWANAYNEFMKSRVDMVKAAAAVVMKRKIEGTPNTVTRLAQQALTRVSPLTTGFFPTDPEAPAATPWWRGDAQTITENQAVTHEALKLDSGAGNAAVDGKMLRAQFSAAHRWPQHYLGDSDGPNLATATAMELPVLKMVETRQEIVETIYRWFIDRVIERAVDSGRIPKEPDAEQNEDTMQVEPDGLALAAALQEAQEQRRQFVTLRAIEPSRAGRKRYVLVTRDLDLVDHYAVVAEGHEQKHDDERSTERDLSYEFSLPSPLRRMMTDLVSAVANTARTFDPNNTNVELSRTLLLIVLAEAFEMEDASDMVERIFPEGYDPMAALRQAMGQEGAPGEEGAPQANFFGPDATDLPPDPDNAYGAPKKAQPAEKVMQYAALQEGRLFVRADGRRFIVSRGRDGHRQIVDVTPEWLDEASIDELPENVRTGVRRRTVVLDEQFADVIDVAHRELVGLTTVGAGTTNGGEG